MKYTVQLTLTLAVLIAPCRADGIAEATLPSASAVPVAFSPLRFGSVKPRGWILEQMRRDLRDGFAGHLDELCREASSDIFGANRNQPGKPNSGNQNANAWWNGETEGNWRCGHIMLACLTGEPEAMAKAKVYIDHILAAQDVDGYLGVYSPELRYKNTGELWGQACLFRGLLAYVEATGDEKVFAAVKRATDCTIAGYAGREIAFGSCHHDFMYTAVLEVLYAKTGDKKYLDFGLRLYHEYPGLKAFFENPAVRHGDGTTTLNGCLSFAHGATVAEAMRVPLWLWSATGDELYRRLGQGAVDAMDSCIMPSGALVSDELVNSPPRPWDVGYEYCAILERELTLLDAVQKFGDAKYADAAEHLWINAGQGSRTPDGTAILYCSPENRLSVNDEIDRRQRFSPTHQQVAVCCNPNATRVAPYYTANSWMRPNSSEPAIAAMLYGPSALTTEIAGTAVAIEEETLYPYSGDVEITVSPAKPVDFCLWLRNPSWSSNTVIVCRGAETRLENGFWKVRKNWKAGDKLTIRFDQAVREVPAINGELAFQYGPLLYVLPVEGTAKTVKTYDKPGFVDYLMSATDGEDKKALSEAQRTLKGFGFAPKSITAPGANPDRPLDHPSVVLEGKLVSEFDGTPVTVQLVPMGAQSARLRQVTFPIVTTNEKPRPFGVFTNPGSVAAIQAPPDVHPMFSHWRIGEKCPVACRFAAKPSTSYQVFIGFNEAWWDKPGQRLMDIEIAGKVVATVDSFQKAKGTPSGYIFPVTTDQRGGVMIRIVPHSGAPDQNTVVCGVLLFPADVKLDADEIIRPRGPKPIEELRAAVDSVSHTLPMPSRQLDATIPKVVPAFIPLPLGHVEPDGWLRDWAIAAKEGITGHLDERHGVFSNSWKGVTGANGEVTGWPLEQSSYWLDGAIRLGFILHDDALTKKIRARLDPVVDGINKADFGTSFIYWRKDKPQGFDSWAHSQMGRALVALYQGSRDKRVLDALVKVYSDYPENMGGLGFSDVSGLCNLDAMMKTYAYSGDSRILARALAAVDRPDVRQTIGDWAAGKISCSHMVVTYENIRLPAVMYPWSGKAGHLRATKEAFDWLDRNHMMPYGVASGEEYAAGVGAGRKTETCNVPAMLVSANTMYCIEGDGVWGDRMEKAFFNAGAAPLARDFQTAAYYQAPNRIRLGELPEESPCPGQGGISFGPLACEQVLCCIGATNRILPYFIANMWMATGDKGLAATLYGPCTVNALAGPSVRVKIVCATEYPFDESIRLTINPQTPVEFPLYLRVPQWCAAPVVEVNGSRVEAKPEGEKKGFIRLHRVWKAGDTVAMKMPMTVCVTRGLEGAYPNELRGYFSHIPDSMFLKRALPYACVNYGPLLFSLPIPDKDPNTPMEGAKWQYALDLNQKEAAQLRVERSPMPAHWDWPLAAPLRLKVPAKAFEWKPTTIQALPSGPVTSGKSETVTLVPYGCTKFHVSMFPVTHRAWDGGVKLDADSVIHQRGPKPLVTLRAAE